MELVNRAHNCLSPLFTLAQSGGQHSTGELFASIAFWLGLLAIGVVVMVVVAFIIRKRMLGPDEDLFDGKGFTIAELRQMRDDGKITDVEFDRAKRAIVAQSLSEIEDNDQQRGGH